MPAPRIGTQRMVASGALATLHVWLAIGYLTGLAQGNPAPTTGRRVSIVSYIDSLGPVWQISFGLTGAALIYGLFRVRILHVVHTVAGAIMATYAMALWFGFLTSDPRPSIISSAGFSSIVVWHLTIGVTYARFNSLPQVAARTSRSPGRAAQTAGDADD